MGDTKNMDGLAVALLLVMGLLLLGGGGAFYLWRRQQVALAEQRAEAERARAMEAMAQMQAEVVRRQTRLATNDRAAADATDDEGYDHEAIEAAIRSVLDAQQQAWNDGDVDQFMEHYWKSDDVTFSSGGKLTRSWQATLENYKERYPSKVEMGTLSFDHLEVRPLGDEAALVLGDWRLDREGDTLEGNFTLVFRRLDGKWVIVHDHASRREE